MAKINLLPWRAERRERRKREFFTQLIVAFVAAVVLVLLWGFWVSLRIDHQNDRNEYLKGQIAQLDAKITEIQNLQKVKDHLLARKRIVEKLQSSRSQMVHLFDQIVQTVPAGVRLTGLTQQGDKLTLDGVAQSNATVAQYMRNIEASPWMGPTTLVSTTNVHNDTNTPYEFQLVVALTTPKNEGSGAPAAGSSSAAPVAASTAAALAATGAPSVATAAAVPVASASAAPANLPAAPVATSAPVASTAVGDKAPQAPAASTTKGGARP
ncbi:MAG TPA: PilN domain-containing protein [Rhodanobacteraceae bacterium]|nr:PilN domain-containing protein [Rhodanobacteraceae bacterium]